MMTVTILRGLPASGKTTIAREYLRSRNIVRVNKDDLRAMLHDGKFSIENETLVKLIRDQIIDFALDHGLDVIVDDTNLNPEHIREITRIADQWSARVVIKDVDTPLEECIRRDALREKPVGESVIRRMADQYKEIQAATSG